MATATRPRLRLLEIGLAPLRWLERSRGWRRRLLIVVYLMIGLVLAFFAWWGASFNNLPDVGEPFDVAKFMAESQVPESEDAFVLYRKAAAVLKDAPILHNWEEMYGAQIGGWKKAKADLRVWVPANREALALWREGTTRPGARPEPLDRVRSLQGGNEAGNMLVLTQLAILEGSRHEAEGRPDEALEWYLAALRACRHYATKGRLHWRDVATSAELTLHDRFVSWSQVADAPLLQKAVDAIAENDATLGPLSDNLKAEYIAIGHALDDLPRLAKALDASGGSTYRYDEMPRWLHTYWFVKREPERSRRVARLIFANWLEHVDKPPAAAPKIVGNSERGPIWGLFEADPAAPYASRALEPEALFSQLESTGLLWRFMPTFPYLTPNVSAERRKHATLMVLLAEEAYFRDTGKKSPSVNTLVPKYLKAVPADYVDVMAEVNP